MIDGQDPELSAKIVSDDEVIAEVIKTEIKMAARDAEWKKAAEVLNIFSLIIYILVVVFTFCLIFIDVRAH